VPTVAEGGLKGYEVTAWFGLAGPKGMNKDAAARLQADTLKLMKSPEVQKQLLAAGHEPVWQDTPDQFYAFMKVEAANWARMVKESGAQVN